ncbi:phosphoglucomutase/phosphomannomutase, alpha/beta/alpha domain I [Selenomonas sp. FOBRC6]|uniref:phosphoglucomutase n=1 Tax=Selenomonas sp. FOBRC6 TaxID=936572 RepID=UPI000277F096|nr:phosphoglucomutase [Selenomonas sp. FOBRC6]EJO20883.1 phosphoglucomutase/phosphomannomutase, alpha/beta/alpha domain I [Selenomonas sp. FOBRC6]
MPLTHEDFMKLANGSDIRGVAVAGVEGEPVTLTPEAANRIAAGFVRLLTEKTGKKPEELQIAVGHDSRISALAIKDCVLTGITHTGAHGIDCVLASTPAMFMATIFEDTAADGSIMITASHLPYNRNGLKFFTSAGGAEKSDIQKILTYAAEAEEAHGTLDNVLKFDLIGRYSEHLVQKIRTALGGEEKPLAGMHIVVDAGNGAGGFFAGRILTPLGVDTSGSRYLNPDGHFPNHIPNPEDPKAMLAIKEAVIENDADLGLIFDTDVDRMSAVLADGTDVSRNALIAMMAAILAPDYPGSTIITDSVTSDGLHDFLENDLHLKHLRYMRGYKNVINECIRRNEAGEVSPLAIETSGHGALSENYYLDDGAYLAVKLIIAAAKARAEGRTLDDLIVNLRQPAEAREIRIKIKDVDDVKAYGKKVLAAFEERAKAKSLTIAEPSYEGVRIVFDGGWALLRMSLHDPNMPLNIEADAAGGADEIERTVKELIRGFDALDLSGFQN